MTPCEKLGYKVGDRFEVIDEFAESDPTFLKGSIIELIRDDKTNTPVFKLVDGVETDYMRRNGYTEHYHGLKKVRPLRTERDKAIDEMAQHYKIAHNPSIADFCGALFDAGYRKPQHKEG